MIQKLLDFLKLRLIETSGLIVLIFSIFYLYSIVTYSNESKIKILGIADKEVNDNYLNSLKKIINT